MNDTEFCDVWICAGVFVCSFGVSGRGEDIPCYLDINTCTVKSNSIKWNFNCMFCLFPLWLSYFYVWSWNGRSSKANWIFWAIWQKRFVNDGCVEWRGARSLRISCIADWWRVCLKKKMDFQPWVTLTNHNIKTF